MEWNVKKYENSEKKILRKKILRYSTGTCRDIYLCMHNYWTQNSYYTIGTNKKIDKKKTELQSSSN